MKLPSLKDVLVGLLVIFIVGGLGVTGMYFQYESDMYDLAMDLEYPWYIKGEGRVEYWSPVQPVINGGTVAFIDAKTGQAICIPLDKIEYMKSTKSIMPE